MRGIDRVDRSRLGPVQIGIILLTVITAAIHLFLFFSFLPRTSPLLISFLLNGIGYLVLVAALYMPYSARYQRAIRWLLIGYTTLTIVLWAIIAHANIENPFGLWDKVVEVLLIVLLIIEDRQSTSRRRIRL